MKAELPKSPGRFEFEESDPKWLRCAVRGLIAVREGARRLLSLPLTLGRGGGRGSFREDVAHAADFGAYSFQFFFNVLVAAVQMIDAVDDGLSIRDEGGEHERGGGAQVGSEDGGGAQRSSAADDGAAAFDLNVGAHAYQFLRMHEAVLKNVFFDDRRAFGLRGERHVLRLHVSGEAGIFFSVHVGGVKRLIAHDADRVGLDRSFHASFSELLQDGGEVRGIASGNIEVPAGEGSGKDEGSGFDAVGDDTVPGAVKL